MISYSFFFTTILVLILPLRLLAETCGEQCIQSVGGYECRWGDPNNRCTICGDSLTCIAPSCGDSCGSVEEICWGAFSTSGGCTRCDITPGTGKCVQPKCNSGCGSDAVCRGAVDGCTQCVNSVCTKPNATPAPTPQYFNGNSCPCVDSQDGMDAAIAEATDVPVFISICNNFTPAAGTTGPYVFLSFFDLLTGESVEGINIANCPGVPDFNMTILSDYLGYALANFSLPLTFYP